MHKNACLKLIIVVALIYMYCLLQHMDARGWNQEFRAMPENILLQKKIERDAGLKHSTGVHLRSNLKEVLAVEQLLEAEGWLDSPECEKSKFENMDKTACIDDNMTQFWALSGKNKDEGITSLMANKPVGFKNVRTFKNELTEPTRDLKSFKRELPKLISEIPENNAMRTFCESLFESEIINSQSITQVEDFYESVKNIIHDCVGDSSGDSSSDESSSDDIENSCLD